jgi:parvulin-like peptidyl-prolyl isomerase
VKRGVNKKALLGVFGGILVVAVAAILIFGDGIGQDDVPDDAVAVVDGTEVSRESFERALAQAATQQGLDGPPPADDPQYEALAEQAMNSVLDTVWIEKEGEERGVEVSDREVEEEFQQTKDENFQTEKEYQDFLEQSGFTQEDIDERVRLQLVSTKIQEEINADAASVPEEDAEKYYESNKEQFEQPESRNIRVIQADTEADAQTAFDQLSGDNSPENWNRVAKEFSTDASSKDTGGVRENVTEGVFPDPLNTEIFDAPQGEVEGPVSADGKFYVFQVDTITEARTIPFDEARAQIDQQLAGQLQQETFQAFLADYRDRWTQLTVCADDVAGERCENFEGEIEPCDIEAQEEQQAQLPEDQRTGVSCPAPVFAAGGGGGPTPAAPGSIRIFTPPSGQPQRPHPPGEDDDAPAPGGALPPGLVPGGAGGAGGATVQPGG